MTFFVGTGCHNCGNRPSEVTKTAERGGTVFPPLLYTAKMAALPVVHPAPLWTNQDLILYHGTVDPFAAAIVSGPVLTSRGRTHTDFGPGFYTTTILRQAQMWAAQIAATRLGTTAAVVQLVIPREDLAGLDALAFVRGDEQNLADTPHQTAGEHGQQGHWLTSEIHAHDVRNSGNRQSQRVSIR